MPRAWSPLVSLPDVAPPDGSTSESCRAEADRAHGLGPAPDPEPAPEEVVTPMATNPRRHVVPAPGEPPRRQIVDDLVGEDVAQDYVATVCVVTAAEIRARISTLRVATWAGNGLRVALAGTAR